MNADRPPLVSVLIPAFQAHPFIADALRSVLAQRDAPAFEVIVAPDDDGDYGYLRGGHGSTRVRVLEGDGHHGVSHARNRALAAARGSLIALCDADDLWPDNYLRELAPLALTYGAACAATEYLGWTGIPFRTVSLPGPRLGLDVGARCLASIRPVWNKALGLRFQDVFAEDVLHVLQLIATIDGGIAVAPKTRYLLRDRFGSTSNAGIEGERRIIAAYDRLIEMARDQPGQLGMQGLPAGKLGQIVEALEFWRFVNVFYLASGCRNSFMRFVTGREHVLWEQFLHAETKPRATIAPSLRST